MFFSPSPRFRDLVQDFLAFQAMYSEDRRTTPSNMRVLERRLGGMRLADIGAREIEALMAERIRGGIGRSTLNRQRATLSKFFTWAIARKHHPGPNPVREVQPFRESTGRTRYLSTTEASSLLLAASDHLKPILLAALHTGGRLSELLALRWKDVDLERGIVTFRKETTKSKRERNVPMSPDLLAQLKAIRRRPPEELLFGFRGEGLKSVRTSFESARDKAHLGDLHFHDLRHTFASWFVQNGGDLYRLQKYLGHSNINLTQRYAHLSPAFLQEGVQYIGPPAAKSPTREREER